MKSFLRRAGWASLALLFVATGLGVGLVAFWQNTHQDNSSSTTNNQTTQAPNCTDDPTLQIAGTAQVSGKLEGAQLPNFTPVAQIPVLSCIDAKVGSNGQAVQSSSTLVVNYTGAVAATGKVFQSSLDSGQPLSIPISNVIVGWQQGMLGMKAGGERRLLIPAAMAYGANPPSGSGIPANADLVFDVSVISVQ